MTEIPTPPLSRQQKAAVVLSAVGPEAAGPILERLDERALRGFAEAMATLRRVAPETVATILGEFADAISRNGQQVKGGLPAARALLEQHTDARMLARILDDADMPSAHNVWQKLARVGAEALSDFLLREHPQTAAVILSKLPAERAAAVLNRLPADRALDIVTGITRIQSLDGKVIEAIGASVSRDFLAGQAAEGPRRNPADRIGAIMNYAEPTIRDHVLAHFDSREPPFAEEIRRKMFTFSDIPARLAPRDVATVLRAIDREALLKAVAGAEGADAKAAEFLIANIASRAAKQLREEIEEAGAPRRREVGPAQNAVIRTIRELVDRGEIKLLEEE